MFHKNLPSHIRGQHIEDIGRSHLARLYVSLQAMFGDADEWPVYCPHCGGVTAKRIDWLLANERLTCECCGTILAYYRERMARDLEDAHRAVANFSRGLRIEKIAAGSQKPQI